MGKMYLVEVDIQGRFLQPNFGQGQQEVRMEPNDLVVGWIDPGQTLGKGCEDGVALQKDPVKRALPGICAKATTNVFRPSTSCRPRYRKVLWGRYMG